MLTTISSTANDKFGVDPMKTREKPIRKAYRSFTEDIAMAHVMRDWHREQRKAREHRAYLKRKAAWEARHPGKGYGNWKRFNTSVWRSEDWE